MEKSRAKTKSPRVVAIIPARGGSKSIPHKNIALVGDKPLIYYTIREAKRSKLLDAIIVSTDDPKIAGISKKYGADVPFLRPKKYATDTSRDIEFLKHAVLWLEKNRGWKPEIVAFLQPTSPSRTAADIDNAIKLMDKTGCDSVRTAAADIPYHPMKTLIITDEKRQKVIPTITAMPAYKKLGVDVPRQLLPLVVRPVGLVYLTRAKFIKQNRVWGDDVRIMLVPHEKCTDIDRPEDLKETENVLSRYSLLD